MITQHTPVFLDEAIKALAVKSGEKYIDATYGEGGHSAEIVRLGGNVLALDADASQVENGNDAIHVVHGNYRDIQEIAEKEGFTQVSGILFDFGLSMRQIRESSKGFSFEKREDPLDMRLGNTGMTVAEYLQTADPELLQHELMKYSEDVCSPAIAQKIVQTRSEKPVAKVQDLLTIIDSVVKTDMTTQRKSYARIFQALRIIINDELNTIKKGLHGAVNLTRTGGKIVVITFHSLEDRIVKAFARNSTKVTETIIRVEKVRKLASFERSAELRVLTVL